MNKNVSVNIQRTIIYIFLISLVALCLTPFLMMIVSATRSGGDIIKGFKLVIGNQFLPNFNALSAYVDVFRGMMNSAIVAVSATVVTAYFSTLTAYGFEFYDFKGKNFLFAFILLMMMVPAQLGLIGFYDLMLRFKLIDTYFPLIVPSIANIFGVFFIRQYMASTIHVALIEAARIDGASEIGIFHKIVFRLSSPAVATITIMAFIGSWNDYMRPLLMILSPAKKTLPVMVGALRGARVIQQNLGAIYAAVAVSVIPILVVFVIFSKYIISGISSGSVKG